MKEYNWDYYHCPSKYIERDSNLNKLRNNRLISNENINDIDKFIYLPIYNTAPGFPEWFKNMSEEELLDSTMLISKFFRQIFL